MASGKKTVAKVARRAKKVKAKTKGKRQYEKTAKGSKVLAKSPKAGELVRKAERRMDRSFGKDLIGQKPALGKSVMAVSVGRYDYGAGDYGVRLTLAAGQNSYASAGLLAGDLVKVSKQGSALEGKYLKVAAVTDATHLRLEDVPALAYAGAAEKTTVTTVADVAGSLNSKYFLISKAADAVKYYVWYDNGTGVNPAVAGRTGIKVTYTNGATAATLATLTKSALDAVSGAWTTTINGSGAQLIITNQAVGVATDAVDGTAPTGFAIAVVTQGAAANPTPSAETSVYVRLEASTVKPSYV